VSSGKRGHVGRSGMTWTWIRSYWFSKIHQGKLWSTVVKRWSNRGILQQQDSVFKHVKDSRPFLDPWGHVDSCRLPHDANPTATVDRFNNLGNQYAKSMDVVFYVSSVHVVLQENSYVTFVINNAFLYT